MRTTKPTFKYSDPLCLEIAESLEKLEGIIANLQLEKITAELFDKAKTSFLMDLQDDMRMVIQDVQELKYPLVSWP